MRLSLYLKIHRERAWAKHHGWLEPILWGLMSEEQKAAAVILLGSKGENK